MRMVKYEILMYNEGTGLFCDNYEEAVSYEDTITVLEDVQDEDTEVLQAHRQKIAEKFGIEWD